MSPYQNYGFISNETIIKHRKPGQAKKLPTSSVRAALPRARWNVVLSDEQRDRRIYSCVLLPPLPFGCAMTSLLASAIVFALLNANSKLAIFLSLTFLSLSSNRILFSFSCLSALLILSHTPMSSASMSANLPLSTC